MAISDNAIEALANCVRVIGKRERLEARTRCRPSAEKIANLKLQARDFVVTAKTYQDGFNALHSENPAAPSLAATRGADFDELMLELVEYLNSEAHGEDRLRKKDPRVKKELQSHFKDKKHHLLDKLVANRIDKAMAILDEKIQLVYDKKLGGTAAVEQFREANEEFFPRIASRTGASSPAPPYEDEPRRAVSTPTVDYGQRKSGITEAWL